MTCAACGRGNREGARFCDACGAPLHAAGAALTEPGVRKVVTIVFADLIGSTALHERLDAESAHRVMAQYYRALHGAVAVHDGRVVKLLGDGLMAAFGIPRVAEDDALRAVRAAAAMQAAFRDLCRAQPGGTLGAGLRVAVNTGEVVVSADQADIVGDPVNVAARLQHLAHDGDVLIGEATRRLVGDRISLVPLGALALRGRAGAVSAYRVVSLDPPAGRETTPFVGRAAELQRLHAVVEQALAGPAARLAVILGSPGLGKTRLIAELTRRLGDRATVVAGHCDAAGGGTLTPLTDALRAGLGVAAGAEPAALRAALAAVLPTDESDTPRIAEGIVALLGGAPGAPEETFFVVRRLLARLAAVRPVVLAVDDLHWAEPLLLELLEHLVQWGAGVPLVVLGSARPELRELRAALTTAGGLVSEVVTLTGLDAGAATRLAASVVGADELPAAVAGRVLATSEGNPLFVGELVRMLVDDQVLRRDGERWVAVVDLAELEVPPTIHALLAARIDRLRPEDRAVLERAAIVGRLFSRGAVAHLLPPELAGDIAARLESLRRSELIEPDPGSLLGEPALRFHHALIRDAAYRRLLKDTRAELHERFAAWLETRVGEAAERDETLGWHLEQAHQLLTELGPPDARAGAVGARAAQCLAAAGRRALARDDLSRAANLLGRAVRRSDAADPRRAELMLDWCEAALGAGDITAGSAAIEALRTASAGTERLTAWLTCFLAQRAVLTEPQALRATADAVEAAAERLAAAGDAAGEAKAHAVHAQALAALGKVGACEAALDRALAAARRAGDRRRANAVLAGAPVAALWGPSPVARASGRCLDVVRVLRITQGAPAVEAVALRCQAVLEALRGRTDAARRMIASSRGMVEELGLAHRVLEADVAAGLIALLEGNAVDAEQRLRGAYDGLRAAGLGADAAQAAALLGRALLGLDRADEADAVSRAAEALAGDDIKAAIAWRCVRAEALARRGAHEAAIGFARVAVEIAVETDALLDHADARTALAVAYEAAGRHAEASAEQARAADIWEAKGATLLVDRMRAAGTAGSRSRPGAAVPGTGTWRRMVRDNRATASTAAFAAAFAARDLAALMALFTPDVEVLQHLTGSSYGYDGVEETARLLFGSRAPGYAFEMMGTLGDALALGRTLWSLDTVVDDVVPSTGPVHYSDLALWEVDDQGRRRRVELFAAEHLGEAIARLYARHAELLPAGAGRRRAARIFDSVAARLGPADVERMAGVLAPDVQFVDHRRAGFPPARSARQLQAGFRSLLDETREVGTATTDVLRLEPDALLVQRRNTGLTRDGGQFETDFLLLLVFDADGLVMRDEQFAAADAEHALARFAELTDSGSGALANRGGAPPVLGAAPLPDGLANAATATLERQRAALAARDWSAIDALLAADFRLRDHRPVVSLDLDREGYLAFLRQIASMTEAHMTGWTVATRGERLALMRTSFTGTDRSIGPSELEFLVVFEVDAEGQRTAMELFDPADLDAAYAALDARYLAGEAAGLPVVGVAMRAFQDALAQRDWPALTARLADDVIAHDHRPLGWESSHGPVPYVDALRALVALAPDVRLRLDDIRLASNGYFARTSWVGTHEGGTFDAPSLFVGELDADGRVRRFDQYDLQQLAAARRRFAELQRP